MAKLKDITEEHVLKAISECGEGEERRRAFLKKHGYGAPKKHWLRQEGKQYPAKAILGVAHGYALPNQGTLEHGELGGGKETNDRLTKLGFEIVTQENQMAASRGSEKKMREDDEDDPPGSPPVGTLEELAGELHLPVDFLQSIDTLLKEKKQVILQGPPGTGKTYVAQKLARLLAGGRERCDLVQFHPSYSYEDFVRGYRPTLLDNQQPGFELKDGPFLRIARKAAQDPDGNYFLIIDEINRGNLAKVFGELYFLLEYRDTAMNLMYQEEDESTFRMPANLYIVGTMNTADRSIALVDLALRRRFAFVDFATNTEPVKGLLHRWLEANDLAGMDWVADIVERANEKLDDHHAAIGPSYFMRRKLDDAAVERIWKHAVLPYVEEHLFGQRDRLGEFALDALRRTPAVTGGEPGDGGGLQDAGGGNDAGD